MKVQNFVLFIWINFVTGAPQSQITTVDDSCVLTLTIPKDSIKSNCNMNEEIIRKMQSMEAQFNHYRTQVGSMEIRLPEIALNLNRYNDKVEQLELVIAKESTYYKHIDGRLKELEKLQTDDEKEPTLMSEPDMLVNPLRSHIMAELHQMKDDLRKEILHEMSKEKSKEPEVTETSVSEEKLTSIIKPLILAEMQYLKEEILKSVKNMMTVKILDQTEEIGSTDEMENHIVEDLIQPIVQQDNMVADQHVTKDQTAQDMARTLINLEDSNVTVYTNQESTEMLQNITKEISSATKDSFSDPENSRLIIENLEKTLEIFKMATRHDFPKDFNEKLSRMSSDVTSRFDKAVEEIDKKIKTIEEKNVILEEKFQDVFDNFTFTHQLDFNTLVQKLNFSENIKKVNDSVHRIQIDIQSMDRRIDSYTNDVALDSKIQTKVETIKTNLDTSLMGMQSSLSAFDNKIGQMERQGNLTSTLLNHFKKTLIHNHNETNTNFETMKSELSELEKRLNEEIKDKTNTIELEKRLEQIEMEFMFFEKSVKDLQKNSSTGYRMLDIKLSELRSKTQSIDWQLTSLHDHAQRILEIERNQTLMKNNYDLMRELMKLIHLEQKLRHDRWIEFNFTHHSVNNACDKKMLVKRNHVSKDGLGAYVGVQLCSPTKYKIFLGNSLDEDFLDIGDQYGHGQDHCQFIGAESESDVKVDTQFPSAMGMKVFLRKQWNEKPHIGFLSLMTPTPRWYECGKSLP